MRNIIRYLAWACLPLLQFGSTGYARAVTPAKPLLDGMSAMQTSLAGLQPKLGDGVVGALNFDPASGEWEGSAPPILEITLNEETGAICAHDPASGQCFARGNATAQLKEARDQRLAQEEAVKHPAPDLQGVMIALVRYQANAEDGYLRANRMPLYVSLYWPNDGRSLDLSEKAIRQLADTGLKLFPGSASPASQKDAVTEPTMKMSVGLPMRRQNRDYEVKYGFYCGALCASWHTAVLHRGEGGWHVLTSHMDAIS